MLHRSPGWATATLLLLISIPLIVTTWFKGMSTNWSLSLIIPDSILAWMQSPIMLPSVALKKSYTHTLEGLLVFLLGSLNLSNISSRVWPLYHSVRDSLAVGFYERLIP